MFGTRHTSHEDAAHHEVRNRFPDNKPKRPQTVLPRRSLTTTSHLQSTLQQPPRAIQNPPPTTRHSPTTAHRSPTATPTPSPRPPRTKQSYPTTAHKSSATVQHAPAAKHNHPATK